MSPEGLITSEFDDAAIIDSEADAAGVLDDDPDDDPDDLPDLELVVLDLAAVTVSGDDGPRLAPGAAGVVRRLRALGVAVALTTAGSPGSPDAALDAIDGRRLADFALSAADGARGAPYPDLPLTALLRAGATSVDGMVVVAATAGAVASGVAAGAGLVVGVAARTSDGAALLDAGADAVIAELGELAELLGLEDLLQATAGLESPRDPGAAADPEAEGQRSR